MIQICIKINKAAFNHSSLLYSSTQNIKYFMILKPCVKTNHLIDSSDCNSKSVYNNNHLNIYISNDQKKASFYTIFSVIKKIIARLNI